jgi:Ribbon-helix-helix protein, copG family
VNRKKDTSRFDNLIGAARGRESTETPKLPESQPVRKSKSTDPDYSRTTVYLPKRLHKQLKAAAADEEREMSDILEQLLEQWLKSRNSDV